MKRRSTSLEFLPPLQYLVRKKTDDYQETTLEIARLELAERQTKLRSRQIAASAARFARDSGQLSSTILETDVVRMVEILARSMVEEFDSPIRFSQENIQDIIHLVESRGSKWSDWEILARGIIISAERELSLEDFLAFEAKVEQMIYFSRCWQAATAIQTFRPTIVRPMAERILAFCRAEENSKQGDLEAFLEETLGEFLARFTDSLKTGSPELIRHGLATAASEVLAANWEAANREWQFLFATLEQTLHQNLGADHSFELKEWFHLLNNFIPRLAFAGYLVSDASKIEKRIPQFGELSGIPIQPFLRAGAAEVLLNTETSSHPPLLNWSILNRCSLFEGADPGGQTAARRELLDVILTDVERSWTDWLDEFWTRFSRILNWCDQETQIRESCRKLADAASDNLKEALEAVRNNQRFPSELHGLLERASIALAYFGATPVANRYLRKWFVSNIALGGRENGWEHIKAISTALKTAIRQHSEVAITLPQELPDLLSHIDLWFDETSDAVDTWPSFTLHGLQLDRCFQDISVSEAYLWLLRQSLMSLIDSGYREAPSAIQKRLASKLFHLNGHSSPKALEDSIPKVRTAISKALPEMSASMKGMFDQIFDVLPLPYLQQRLWEGSDDLAKKVASALYEKCEEYRQKAGEESQSLCSRDTSIIVRRVAASLSPEIDDRQEFVGSWWNNLVNLYLVTRTGGIFYHQLEAIAKEVSGHSGSQAARMVRGILRPVFETATEGFKETIPPRLIFRRLACKPISEEFKTSSLPQEFLKELVNEFKSWLDSSIPDALKYANSLYPANWNDSHLHEFKTHLVNCLENQLLGCGLHNSYDKNHLEKILPDKDSARHAARLCSGLHYACAQLSPSREALYHSCISELSFFFRQRAAGFQLEKIAGGLARDTAAHIHLVVPDLVQKGANSPSQDKCARDFGLLLENIAATLKSSAPSEVLVAIHRYVIQMILPYTNYSRDMWRMMWQAASMHSNHIEELDLKYFLHALFHRLEALGRNFETIGPIAKKINSGDATVFSPNPAEELAWRDLANSVLALSCLDGEDFEIAKFHVSNSIPSVISREITRRLPQLSAALRKWFPASDLQSVAASVDAVTECLEAHINLREFTKYLSEIATSFAEAVAAQSSASSNALLLIQIYLRASNFSAPARGTWGPADLPLAAYLLEKSKTPIDVLSSGFSNALTNLVGPSLPKKHRLDAVVSELRTLMKFNGSAEELASKLSKENKSEVCLRDQTWFCRRVLHAAKIGESGQAVMRWAREEVVPYAGEHAPEVWLAIFGESLEVILKSTEDSSHLHQVANQCLSHLPSWTLALYLFAKAPQLAGAVVEKSLPQLGDTSPEKCTRDVSFALYALAFCADKNSPYGNWNAWWQESVKPFLRNETIEMKNLVYGQLPAVLRETTKEAISDCAAALVS